MALGIFDERLPEEAKKTLSRMFDVMEFSSEGITYNAISGHPDIFFCKVKDTVIVSPGIPERYRQILEDKRISHLSGIKSVNAAYPGSAVYNAAVSDNLIIHRLDITDSVILNKCDSIEKIFVTQGYTRCNLLPLKNNSFITSDPAICKKLQSTGLDVLYVSPEGITLPGFSHGFFGGTCGIFDGTVFVIGNFDLCAEGDSIRRFLRKLKYDIIELYNGPLFDGGSIIFC